jgi:hypothetical protein
MTQLISYAVVTVTLLLAACSASRGPVIGSGDKTDNVGGTISGIVRAATDNTPLPGRRVTAVNLQNGQRIDATTATNGGYTIKVPVGRYRLEVELQGGETVPDPPDEVHITTSDLDAGRNFAIAAKF